MYLSWATCSLIEIWQSCLERKLSYSQDLQPAPIFVKGSPRMCDIAWVQVSRVPFLLSEKGNIWLEVQRFFPPTHHDKRMRNASPIASIDCCPSSGKVNVVFKNFSLTPLFPHPVIVTWGNLITQETFIQMQHLSFNEVLLFLQFLSLGRLRCTRIKGPDTTHTASDSAITIVSQDPSGAQLSALNTRLNCP